MLEQKETIQGMAASASSGGATFRGRARVCYLRHAFRGQLLPPLRTVRQDRPLFLQESLPAVSGCLGRRQSRHVPQYPRPSVASWLYDSRLSQRHADGLIPGFLCFSLKIDIIFIFSISTLILAVIAIKQMSGFSYLNTIWRMIVALVPFFFLGVFLIVVGYLLLLLYAYIKFS